ncbi:hypothetical protein PFNF54_00174 [Plasmodium falciparum NF54]|uniref:Uncharacterized protein n=1 Tax=Plasmodium falciparum (isolate NF54) TaxID=5843 RepID=W7KD92_PLAFO|nr:hypothetical protein PFNF54_00174 [Plasmodium falciparum NF54]
MVKYFYKKKYVQYLFYYEHMELYLNIELINIIHAYFLYSLYILILRFVPKTACSVVIFYINFILHTRVNIHHSIYYSYIAIFLGNVGEVIRQLNFK